MNTQEHFRILDLEHVQNTKDFALIPGRVGDIRSLCTLKDRLSRILILFFCFFPEPKMDVGDAKKRIPGSPI